MNTAAQFRIPNCSAIEPVQRLCIDCAQSLHRHNTHVDNRHEQREK